MKKWEYLMVKTWKNNEGKDIASVAGKKKVFYSREEMLNELGEEGWEMVNFAMYEDCPCVYAFKREKR